MINIKSFKRHKNRTKSIGFLLVVIILPLIFNTPLFIMFDKNNDKGYNEKFPDVENPITSSNHPSNAGDYDYYKTITIDHTRVSGTENLIDFPVLISLFDSDLHDNTQSDGDDIAFSNGFQWLDYEIELFNQSYNATHARLVAWVRIPVLSVSENTIIRMYYGNSFMDSKENPTGVWNSNYEAVWHMNQDPSSSSILDSTVNNNDLTPSGFTSDQRIYTGELGTAIAFDGNNDYLSINSFSGPTDGFTFETCFKFDTEYNNISNQMYLFSGNTPFYSNNMPRLRFRTGVAVGSVATSLDDSDSVDGTKAVWAPDTWFHYAFRFSVPIRTTTLYLNSTVDGIKVDSDLQVPHSAWDKLCIASDYGAYVWGPGAISEFRVVRTDLSIDWISTEYNNQYNPNSFYSVSSVNNVYVPSIFDFEYFKEITIDHNQIFGTSDHVNFPILLSIFDSDLHDKVQPDGDDIAFNNGTAWLSHEFELFNQNFNSTHAQLIAWVKIPLLSPIEDTIIRMYYGNSTMESQENSLGVWDSNYLGIWHLSENGNGTLNEFVDSSKYYNHGQGGKGDSLYIPTQSSGLIGYSQDFNNLDGKYDFIDCGDDPILDITENQITLQAWVHHSIAPVSRARGIINHKGWYEGYSIFIRRDMQKVAFNLPGETHQLTSAWDITTDEWHYVVATYDGSWMRIYIDGAQDPNVMAKTGDIEPSSAEKDVWIGHADQPQDVAWSGEWEGLLDEIRISRVSRSADWIKTEYYNQYDPSSFYSLGNEIKVEDDIPQDASYFRNYKIIKIDNKMVFGSGELVNFPVLISLVDSDLRVDVQPDGDDIAFSLGSLWLDHEIEVFNQIYNGTHAELIAWVRIPQLSTSLDTYIRMYYGNATMSIRENPVGVWDTSYKGVWHLKESSGFTQDSTSYSENGLVTGTVIRPSTGQISNAYNYGTDGTFNVGDPADGHLDFGTESFMVSMWINIDTSTGTWQIPLYKGSSSTWDPGYCFATPTTGDSIRFHITDGINNIPSPSARIDSDSWVYIVGIVDRTNGLIRIYKNGTEIGTGTDISTILSIDGDLHFQCAEPTFDFDGLLDEIRVLNVTRSQNWIKTEYYNQYDPNSFYSIGQEEGKAGIVYSNLQVNAIDLYGNPVPSANISIYNQTILIGSNLTDSSGNTLFMNTIQGEYNFTASITSDIGSHIEIVNITSEAIVINQSVQMVNIICDVSSNFFEIVDIDGIAVDSGWIIVGNSTHDLQNCSIDGTGHTRFWWVDTLPYQYNYTVFYQDTNYNPQIIPVASGDITVPNSSIQVQASLTTVDFTVLTLITQQSVSGVKLLLTSLNTGESIVNLTSDNDGKATLRWMNSSGINGNYSLQLVFFGASRRFNMTSITQSLVMETNFTVSATQDYYIYIEILLENYETELISLNPTDYISVKYGSQLNLRMLFNVSKAIGAEQLLGPTYSDIMLYEIYKGADLIQFGNLGIEGDYTGTHSSLINTENLESDVTYLIFVSAQKSGYSIPQEILLQLSVLENDLILNQSQNDDSVQSVYWSESIDFSVKTYGEISESFTTETSIFQSIDHNLRFSLPNIDTSWNLTQITFNIYNISWNVNESDINLSILDPFGVNRVFNISNHAGWDYNLGVWTGITINIDKESPTFDNNFEFSFSGTYDNTIDIIADAYFIRNGISAQYRKYNVSNLISVLSESEGWAIKNITFIIQNCYNTTTWEKVNLSTLTILNISTADGFKYSLNSGDENGNGVLSIDDRIIYPLDNQFLFNVESPLNVIFDVIIKVEYGQLFYQNQYLETNNITDIQKNIPNGGSYQLGLTDNWDESYAVLLINNINNQIQYFSPSEIAMNITIGGQTYSVSNTLPGQGIVSLTGLNKDSVYSAVIETNQPVNFTLSYKISYSRKVTFETLGTVSYILKESPDIFGTVNYYPSLGEYLQTLDTFLIDAGFYTIKLEVTKENYITSSKDFDFIVMNRLTLINGDSKIYRKLEFIYIRDAINFTFLYTDELTGSLITDLATHSFIWEKYDIQGNVTDNGAGTLIQDGDGSLVLDFDSETKAVGDYLLIVNLEKENYDYKNAMILLTIQTRFLSYSLSNNFQDNQLSIVQGRNVLIQVNLTDPTQGGIPLLNASITLNINGNDYNFTEYVNGTYSFSLRTYDVNTFFSSKTLTGIINITREDYFSEVFFITIVVEMEEIFPGMPTFYFLIIIIAIITVVGSIVGYRVIKNARIPTFVKNVREIKKEIKHGKDISDSYLYQNKEVFVGEIVKDKWSNIGLSMGDILALEIKKSKKLPQIERMGQVHDFKPLGLILMKWDQRIGAELLGKYPSDINVSEKTLMQIYGTHEYSAEKGLITLIRENLNVLSYYTGPESGYYIMLILNRDDDPDIYEGEMANIATLILQNLEDDVFLQMIPLFFRRVSIYPTLTYEQNLIFYYQDSIKQMIINILRDYGIITKSELNIWVKDRELERIIDLEAILAELIKFELIKVASVKGIPSELIFLTKDIFMLRVPPDILFKDPVKKGLPIQFTKSYQEEVQNYFKEYHPTEEDMLKLLDNLIDHEVYETLRLLRTAFVTMKDFEKLKTKGVTDIYGVLKKLYDTNMIRVFKDENDIEYYALITDFYVDLIFPKYLLSVIKRSYTQKSKTDKVLLEYLDLLEDSYIDLKSKR
ncbi:MAG: LamG-like jellyroll fold domain-containing protein [Promethearchaeota archaeon]|jgi:hypothetical protein